MRLSRKFYCRSACQSAGSFSARFVEKNSQAASGDIRRESTPIASAKQSSHGATQGSADLSV